VLERLSVTEVPLGAGPLRLIVPVELAPPPICCGEKAKPTGAGGCTVSVVVCWMPWLEAVMVTGVELLTGSVVIENCAVVLPAGTFTLDGTLTMFGLALLRVTLVPPAGAGPLSVTVPCTAAVRPTTAVGFTATLLGATVPLTVRVADRVPPR
jgi:hypothetical protein